MPSINDKIRLFRTFRDMGVLLEPRDRRVEDLLASDPFGGEAIPHWPDSNNVSSLGFGDLTFIFNENGQLIATLAENGSLDPVPDHINGFDSAARVPAPVAPLDHDWSAKLDEEIAQALADAKAAR